MQELNLLAQLLAAHFKQLQGTAIIVCRLKERLIVKGLEIRMPCASRGVSCHSWNADLHTNVTEALVHIALCRGDHICEFRPACVTVKIHGFAAFATKELIDRHAR